MSVPVYNRDVSLILSRIMDDLLLNEEIVLKKRRAYLLWEHIETLNFNLTRGESRIMDDLLLNEESVLKKRRAYLLREHIETLNLTDLTTGACTTHIFGSQTEVTTTRGLNSDTDRLYTLENTIAIQDWKDWAPGICIHMMIQDETTFPGYCKLQALRRDMPLPVDMLPVEGLPFSQHVYDEKRRIILTHNWPSLVRHHDFVQNGPARTFKDDTAETDIIVAIRCDTWPKHYKQWSSLQEERNWPTPEMVEYMESSGCFVVPVGHRLAERRDREWRISTSMAERCLMFNMNITQIRCYVLLKMVNKTFIKPFVPDVISSYICKTLLFHTLERTSRDLWREQNLLVCVVRVLLSMYGAVYSMNCPNYFNESANLLLGKIDQVSRGKLLSILKVLLQSQGGFLLEIDFDNISDSLVTYILDRHLMSRYEENELERVRMCAEITVELKGYIYCDIIHILTHTDKDSSTRSMFLKTTLEYAKKGRLQYKAASLLFPFLCSHIATVDTSERIRRGHTVSPTSVLLYKFSLNSDAASSRLRFASFLYCTGQYERTLSVLQQVEQIMEPGAIQLCPCHSRQFMYDVRQFGEKWRNDKLANVCLCVMFSRAESQCCPPELLFELFRSTDEDRSTVEDRLGREEGIGKWMDLVVMECLPFLYYLQYMAARHLGQRDLQYRALEKLIKCTIDDESLGHRETVLNVLGQCMEQENRIDKALHYYRISLQLKPRNNAVKWLITKLLFNAIQRR